MIKFRAIRKILVAIEMHNSYGAPAEDPILRPYFCQKLTFQNSNMANYKEIGIQRNPMRASCIIYYFHVKNCHQSHQRAIMRIEICKNSLSLITCSYCKFLRSFDTILTKYIHFINNL